jgi:hypothetical protein
MELFVKFNTDTDFEKAKAWFDYSNESSTIVGEYENEEFRSIGFSVSHEQEADNLEMAIREELEETDIKNYYFELE